jgi:coenzyme F420-0:L-glutamate ligase / coenzyme F420-1:gamma-L-glutamate ligase
MVLTRIIEKHMSKRPPLLVIPIEAPVQQSAFHLLDTLRQSLVAAGEALQDGDVLAVSSKYTAISEGRVISLQSITPTTEALALASRYHMNPVIAQLVLQEADHIFGGIPGFLLTAKEGIISPNAGIDRSNIPHGYAVLFPAEPYRSAAELRGRIAAEMGADVGVILTDSWLMPGRLGTSGVALATAGFKPVQDERGKADLFGNPMQVTQRGIADSLCICAQMVMGERDEATPFAIIRNSGVPIEELTLTAADVSIDWHQCIYIESLTRGLLQQP